jgi:hypothetical protein
MGRFKISNQGFLEIRDVDEDNQKFIVKLRHKESRLGSISRVTFTKIAKLCREVKDPLIDIDKDDNITLTDKGSRWCLYKKVASKLLVQEGDF